MKLPLLSLIAVPLIAIAYAANAGDRRPFARGRHGRERDAMDAWVVTAQLSAPTICRNPARSRTRTYAIAALCTFYG